MQRVDHNPLSLSPQKIDNGIVFFIFLLSIQVKEADDKRERTVRKVTDYASHKEEYNCYKIRQINIYRPRLRPN